MMKHIKKHLKKINKETIKKGATTLVLIFFAMVMIFQKDLPDTQLQFVRNMDEILVHGVANDNPPPSQRDYLFQNETNDPASKGVIERGTVQPAVVNTPIPSTDIPKKDNMDNLINPNEITQVINNTKEEQTLYTGSMNIETQTTIKIDTNNIQSGSCITPWNEEVKNMDFVLAYEQRKDVDTICNVQKRVCTNNTLGGTFTQRSCKDNVIYTYQKNEIISYNQKVLNNYIQPTTPVNVGAEFNTEGKINAPAKRPTDVLGTTNTPIIIDKEVIQTPVPIKADCTTNRGQTVKHGQFVKAYKTPRGFVDMQCEVEIRPCVKGILKGTFIYPKCTFKNITYNDYLQGTSKSFDQPTAQDINQSINGEFTQPVEKGFRSFDRVKSIFTIK